MGPYYQVVPNNDLCISSSEKSVFMSLRLINASRAKGIEE